MPAPFEIVAAPFTLYWAAVGTAFPATPAVAPAAAWTLVGASGDRNYKERGVTVTHEQNVQLFRGLGSTGPVKAFRTSEALRISLELADITLEMYRLALNNNTVTDVAAISGVAGYRRIDLYQNLTVAQMALLVRGQSPYVDDAFKVDFRIPVVVQIASPAPVHMKGEPAGLALEFTALEDPNAATAAERFGRLFGQDAAALP
ncbi:MAG: hypothetical protein AAB368_03455 [bacterium]